MGSLSEEGEALLSHARQVAHDEEITLTQALLVVQAEAICNWLQELAQMLEDKQ